MKKILILCFSVLCTNFLLAQENININAPSSVEVGLNSNFGFTFRPVKNIPLPTDPNKPVSSYKITAWFISSANSNMNNSGYGSYNNNSQALNSYEINQSQSLNFPIKWEDNSNLLTDYINISVHVEYFNSDGYVGSRIEPATYTVNINRIYTPTISSPTILSCCTTPVTFTASNYGTADVFNWTVGGGTYTGSGASIAVTPSSPNGAVSVSCIVRRSAGLSTYTRTNSTTISRTTRTASYTPNYSTPPPYYYICKGSGGQQMIMLAQCGISNINWVAPNCTITGQNTLTPTITPTSAIPTGSFINIYAVVAYTGGCTATTPSISFKILDSTVPPTPQGSFNVTLPANANSICDTDTFDLAFVSTDGFNNGITTIAPVFLWGPSNFHYKAGKGTTVTVSNKNLCTGLSTSKTFVVYPPAPCASSAKVASAVTSSSKLSIAPNPTNGTIKVTLPETLSGNYQIYDQTNSILVQEAKFDNQTELQIEMSHKLKSGVYILKVVSENNIFTERIILNK